MSSTMSSRIERQNRGLDQDWAVLSISLRGPRDAPTDADDGMSGRLCDRHDAVAPEGAL